MNTISISIPARVFFVIYMISFLTMHPVKYVTQATLLTWLTENKLLVAQSSLNFVFIDPQTCDLYIFSRAHAILPSQS